MFNIFPKARFSSSVGNGLFNSASLDLDFAKTKSLVDSCTGQNLVTFTRASNGTYVDSQGVIRAATTNLLLRSEEFDNASWIVVGTAGVTANADTAPNGATSAERITFAAASYIRQFVGTVIPGATYTVSLWVKKPATGGASAIRIASNNVNAWNTGFSQKFTLTSQWQRITATGTLVSSNTSAYVIFGTKTEADANDADCVGDVLVWGAQLEQSSTVGEYIPTTSTINSAPRFDHAPTTGESLGLLVEEQRTNSIRNNTMVGAVAGTPGTNPTNWSYVTTQSNGLSRSVVGTGTENGIAYIDYRFFGTTIASPASIAFGFESIAAAVSGQTWTSSIFLKLVSGTTTGITQFQLGLIENNSGGSFVGGANYNIATPTNANLATQRPSATRTLIAATTAFCVPTMSINVAGSTAIDFTIRIGLPQLEQGAFATSVIPTTTAAVTRSADVASITGSNFSSWYRQDSGSWYCSANSLVFDSSERGLFGIDTGNFARGYHASTNSPTRIRTRRRDATNSLAIDATSSAETSARVALVATSTEHATTYNGGAIQTNATALTLDPITVLRIGFQNITGTAANLYLCGCISRLTYWPQRLPNETLQGITQ